MRQNTGEKNETEEERLMVGLVPAAKARGLRFAPCVSFGSALSSAFSLPVEDLAADVRKSVAESARPSRPSRM